MMTKPVPNNAPQMDNWTTEWNVAMNYSQCDCQAAAERSFSNQTKSVVLMGE